MSSSKPSNPSSPGRGNLTGPARVLNDLVVTYYNTVQKWKTCLIDGIKAIQSIQDSSDDVKLVEKNCEKIGKLVELMVSHLSEMKDSQRKLDNLSLLNKGKTSPCYSWSFQDIAETVEMINTAYEMETKFREKLIISLRSRSAKELDAIAVLWLHCGQVDSRIDAKLEAILRECALSL